MTNKKTTKKKSSPKETTFTLKEYGQAMTVPTRFTFLGESIPTSIDDQVKFWEKKYEEQRRKTFNAEQKVDLLTSIINRALTQECNRDHTNG